MEKDNRNMILEGIIKTKLKIINSNEGSVFHGLKKVEKSYNRFGELYFSSINHDCIKAWKFHKKMTSNLIVPVGEVLFCFFDDRKESKTYKNKFKVILSQRSYYRLTVPPRIWFGFKGLGKTTNLIANLSNMVHEPSEMIRKNVEEIDVNWSKNIEILNKDAEK